MDLIRDTQEMSGSLRILHSVIKRPRGKEQDGRHFPQDMLSWCRGVISLFSSSIPCFGTSFWLYFLPAPEGSEARLMQTTLWYLDQLWGQRHVL